MNKVEIKSIAEIAYENYRKELIHLTKLFEEKDITVKFYDELSEAEKSAWLFAARSVLHEYLQLYVFYMNTEEKELNNG